METLRTFIAIELDEAVRKTLSTIQEHLKKTGADVTWVKPDNIHLTLKFLGDTPIDKIDTMAELIRKACRKKSFVMELTHLGAFPKMESPQVLWIGITKGKDHMKEIVLELEEILHEAGFQKEKREFDSHITLGRVRSNLNRFALTKAMMGYSFTPVMQEVNCIVFLKSTLSPRGPIYETLKTLTLNS